MRKNLFSCLAAMALLFAGTSQAFAQTEIKDADDLCYYAGQVNSGEMLDETFILVNDIDIVAEDYVDEFEPMGNEAHPFKGTFDGQGHKVNLAINKPDETYQGLFGVVTGGAYIKNVVVTGSVVANKFAGGICGGTNGYGSVTFEKCGNEANVRTTNENAGGIFGVDMLSQASITMIECYNMGKIESGWDGGALTGWAGDKPTVKYCWNTGELKGYEASKPLYRHNDTPTQEGNWDRYGAQDKVKKITDAMIAGMQSGKFCFEINEMQTEDVHWFQKIGEDAHPYPFADRGVVHAVGDLWCDGTSKDGETHYANSGESTIAPHTFSHGTCTRCHTLDPDYEGVLDGDAYVIDSPEELLWFALYVNNGHVDANAKVTADINYTYQEMIGLDTNEGRYAGVFDGQDHKITIALKTDVRLTALFRALNGATIENLFVDGTIDASVQCAGGIAAASHGATVIKNCVAAVNIKSDVDGDGTFGGIIAFAFDKATIQNCAFVGSIDAPLATGSGGIMGYANGGGDVKILNCYVAGDLDLATGKDNIVISRNNPYIEDCWVIEDYEGLYNPNDFTEYFDVETLATGEFCYSNLNATETTNVAWYQTLGEDAYPVPFATHGTVYVAGAQTCDGTPKGDAQGFSNDPAGNRDPHAFTDGFCSVCHAVDASYKTAEADGFFAIANGHELEWFAAYTKTQDTKNANAKLVADIDYTAQEMIGAVRCNYGGTFDGQGHTVKVNFVRGTEGRAALFNMVEGATIKNMTVAGKTVNDGQFAAGLVVEAYDNTVVKNIVVSQEITSDYDGDGTHGGIMAIAHGNVAIENVAFVGVLDAALSVGSAGIIGYTHGGSNTTIKNSYVAGELILIEGDNNTVFARNNPTIENCYASWDVSYYNSDLAEDVLFEVDGEMASGELCYNLGNKKWFQTLGTDAYPVPFSTHATVYAHGTVKCDGEGDLTYDNVEGQPTYENHNFVGGECAGCHNAFQISDAEGMIDLAFDVMGGDKTDAYIELTQDIDLAGTEYFPIGGRSDEGSNPFRGQFNGKGHTVNLAIEGTNNLGLIGVVADGAIIENVIVTGSVSGSGYSAGIVGATTGSGKVTIRNCGNEADVTVAEANAAGILGVDDLGAMDMTIINCYNTGAIAGGRESAAFAGWLSSKSTITNSWNSGSVTGLDGSNTFARSSNGAATYTNCYETIGSQVKTVTDEQVANGELTALLNNGAHAEIWYQTVGTDAHPMLDFQYLADAIETIPAQVANGATSIYTIGGAKVATMQKGINIIRMEDGSVRKVLVK